MQSKKARLPQPSIWIRGNPLHRKSDEERLAEQKRKRFKELREKKKHEKRLMGQPIPEREQKEGIEKFDQEIREEAKELKDDLQDAGVYAVVEIKREFKPLSQILRESRFAKYLQRKSEEYKEKHSK